MGFGKFNIIPFLIYPINIKFFGILNLADIFVLKNLKLNRIFRKGVAASIFFAFLTLLQSLIFGNEIKLESFYLVNKILLASIWVGAYYGERMVFNWKLLFFLYFPIFIGVAGFVFDGVNSVVLSLWGVNNSQTWRYGGIFGGDVNSYGFYSTMAAVLIMATHKYTKISWMLVAFFLSFSAFSIITSGMRAGIISFLSAGVLVSLFDRNAFKYVKNIFLIFSLVIVGAYFFIINFISDVYADILIGRFSIEALVEDVNPDGAGNIVAATNYFKQLVPGEISYLQYLIGIDSSINFVDNAYVSIFIKYGIIGILILGYICLLISREILSWDRQNNSFFGKIIIIFTFIIGLKGNFPFAGYYIYMVLIIFSLIDKNKYNLGGQYVWNCR